MHSRQFLSNLGINNVLIRGGYNTLLMPYCQHHEAFLWQWSVLWQWAGASLFFLRLFIIVHCWFPLSYYTPVLGWDSPLCKGSAWGLWSNYDLRKGIIGHWSYTNCVVGSWLPAIPIRLSQRTGFVGMRVLSKAFAWGIQYLTHRHMQQQPFVATLQTPSESIHNEAIAFQMSDTWQIRIIRRATAHLSCGTTEVKRNPFFCTGFLGGRPVFIRLCTMPSTTGPLSHTVVFKNNGTDLKIIPLFHFF